MADRQGTVCAIVARRARGHDGRNRPDDVRDRDRDRDRAHTHNQIHAHNQIHDHTHGHDHYHDDHEADGWLARLCDRGRVDPQVARAARVLMAALPPPADAPNAPRTRARAVACVRIAHKWIHDGAAGRDLQRLDASVPAGPTGVDWRAEEGAVLTDLGWHVGRAVAGDVLPRDGGTASRRERIGRPRERRARGKHEARAPPPPPPLPLPPPPAPRSRPIPGDVAASATGSSTSSGRTVCRAAGTARRRRWRSRRSCRRGRVARPAPPALGEPASLIPPGAAPECRPAADAMGRNDDDHSDRGHGRGGSGRPGSETRPSSRIAAAGRAPSARAGTPPPPPPLPFPRGVAEALLRAAANRLWRLPGEEPDDDPPPSTSHRHAECGRTRRGSSPSSFSSRTA